MDREELIRKYKLVTSEEYKAIRSEAFNYIIKMSNSSVSPEAVKGMLLLVGEIDSWADDYMNELAKRKD